MKTEEQVEVTIKVPKPPKGMSILDFGGKFKVPGSFEGADFTFSTQVWMKLSELAGNIQSSFYAAPHNSEVCRINKKGAYEEGVERTVKEWLSMLPDGYRERALKNCKYESNHTENSMSCAINNLDIWQSSKEGADFWNDLWEHYKYPEDSPFPPLPEERLETDDPERAYYIRKIASPEEEIKRMIPEIKEAFTKLAKKIEKLELLQS